MSKNKSLTPALRKRAAEMYASAASSRAFEANRTGAAVSVRQGAFSNAMSALRSVRTRNDVEQTFPTLLPFIDDAIANSQAVETTTVTERRLFYILSKGAL